MYEPRKNYVLNVINEEGEREERIELTKENYERFKKILTDMGWR